MSETVKILLNTINDLDQRIKSDQDPRKVYHYWMLKTEVALVLSNYLQRSQM